jgi:hypothetical protein
MSILRLVRNFALLAVLALAAHAAAGADKHHGNPHYCGGRCGFFGGCAKGCVCVDVGVGLYCVPKPK